MSPAWRRWLLLPILPLAAIAGAELGARFDDLVRYGVPFFAPVDGGYDLTVRDSGTVRGRSFGRYKTIQLNAAGFRGPSISPLPRAGCVRVVVLGASESVVGAEEAGTEYPARVQEALARHGCFEVQNAAVSNFDLPHITVLWNHWVARWSADLVIVYPSPAFYLRPDPPEYPASPGRPLRRPRWWRSARLEDREPGEWLLPAAIQKWKARRDIAHAVAAHQPGWEYQRIPADRLSLYERHLDSLVLAIRASHAEPILVTHAMRFPDPPTDEDELELLKWQRATRASGEVVLDFERAANAAMIALGQRRGVMVVDAAARLSGRREWFTDYCHFTRAGRAVLGALLADSVLSAPHLAIRTRSASALE
jgi:hypothetical protein